MIFRTWSMPVKALAIVVPVMDEGIVSVPVMPGQAKEELLNELRPSGSVRLPVKPQFLKAESPTVWIESGSVSAPVMPVQPSKALDWMVVNPEGSARLVNPLQSLKAE